MFTRQLLQEEQVELFPPWHGELRLRGKTPSARQSCLYAVTMVGVILSSSTYYIRARVHLYILLYILLAVPTILCEVERFELCPFLSPPSVVASIFARIEQNYVYVLLYHCLLYTSPSPRD